MRAWLGLLGLLVVVGCDQDPEDTDVEPDRVDTILGLTGDTTNGESVWNAQCVSCHDGQEAAFGDLPSETVADAVLEGPGGMPDLSGLPDQDIADVIAYLESTLP